MNFFTLLKKKESNKHRGGILEAVVKRSPVKITQLVKRMGISRGTYYNHINDPKLQFEIIEQYGKILNYDFSGDFPDMKKYFFEDPEGDYNMPKTIEEAIEQRDYWKNKYIKLLESILGK